MPFYAFAPIFAPGIFILIVLFYIFNSNMYEQKRKTSISE